MKIDIIDPPDSVDNPLFDACIHEVMAGEHKNSLYVNIIFLWGDELRRIKKKEF